MSKKNKYTRALSNLIFIVYAYNRSTCWPTYRRRRIFRRSVRLNYVHIYRPIGQFEIPTLADLNVRIYY